MEITTKFGIGDEVLFLSDNKVVCSKIAAVKVVCITKGTNITYGLFCDRHNGVFEQNRKESELFSTREELIASL